MEFKGLSSAGHIVRPLSGDRPFTTQNLRKGREQLPKTLHGLPISTYAHNCYDVLCQRNPGIVVSNLRQYGQFVDLITDLLYIVS